MLAEKIIPFRLKEKTNLSEIYKIDVSGNNLVEIPYFLSPVHAGIPSISEDYVEKNFSIDSSLVRNPEETFAIKVSGNSMYPVILEGDILIVDRTLKYTAQNKIVVALVDGGHTVKFLKIVNNELCLVARNKKYKNIRMKDCDQFEIEGVVIFKISDMFGMKF